MLIYILLCLNDVNSRFSLFFFVFLSALIVSGATKTARDEMMDEVIAASQLQQVLLATTQDAAII